MVTTFLKKKKQTKRKLQSGETLSTDALAMKNK